MADGWTARNVVGHLVTWRPGFLAAGADVRLPAVQTRLLGFIGRDPGWTQP